MKLKKGDTLYKEIFILSNLVTPEEADTQLELLEKNKKILKEWAIASKMNFLYIPVSSEKEIKEKFNILKERGVEVEKYFSKIYFYRILEDIEI